MINIENLSKTYPAGDGQLTVLNEFFLEVPSGAVAAVVGPSGCGKSTLIRLLAGLDEPDGGKITLSHQAKPESQVSIAFQDHGLLEWLTVSDNVKLTAELRREPIADTSLKDLLLKVGLQGFEDAYPDQLSGGMKSRVALARALAVNAPVVLLDEPFRSLDEITRQAVSTDSIELLRRRQQTVLLVTHSVIEAVRLADFVVVVTARPMSVARIFEVKLTPDQRHSIANTATQEIANSVLAALFERSA